MKDEQVICQPDTVVTLVEKNVVDMPVPSSYNDITTSAKFRDFVGWAWYFRTFFVPTSWQKKVGRIYIFPKCANFNSTY